MKLDDVSGIVLKLKKKLREVTAGKVQNLTKVKPNPQDIAPRASTMLLENCRLALWAKKSPSGIGISFNLTGR